MKRNVGTIDRAVRIIIGLGILSFAFMGVSSWGYLGLVPLLTGITGWCPPYSLLGISTCRKCTDSKLGAGCACGSKN
ncbi:MAG: YgaP family membrane protein [Thermodesulfovibrionales bacterium]